MKRALIADDHPENLYFLEVLLKGNGFDTVDSAENGAQALELARLNRPDLIISDILMPVMDGYALCKELKADPNLKDIPFIFYTATFTTAKDEALALSLGADRFVIKPQEPDALMEIIRDVLSVPRREAGDDQEWQMQQYSEALFRKLEKKMVDLEQANRDLEASEARFRQFVIQCPLPIAVNNREGAIELLNEAFCKVTGYGMADLPDVATWWTLAYPDPAYRNQVQTVWQVALEQAVSDGSMIVPGEEYRVVCKDGTTRIMEISAALIEEQLLVLFNDLTERKQVEQERAALQTQLIQQDKLASIGQLAAGVAHEINNPAGFTKSNLVTLTTQLTRITSYIKSMEELIAHSSDQALPGSIARLQEELRIVPILQGAENLLSDCVDGTERIVRIVQNLKIFAHRDTEKTEPVNLNNSLDTILSIVWNEIKQVATLEKQYGELPEIRCNLQQISQVFMNLLVNAAQSIRDAGSIIVKTWADPDAVCVVIADTGCGIPPENLDKIFDPFFTTKDVGKGTGLGLSISAEIVKKHGGSITVESHVDKGSTFTVRLPVTP